MSLVLDVAKSLAGGTSCPGSSARRNRAASTMSLSRRCRVPGVGAIAACRLRADMALALIRCKARKRGEMLLRTLKAGAERPTQRDVTLDIVHQHAGLPAQG